MPLRLWAEQPLGQVGPPAPGRDRHLRPARVALLAEPWQTLGILSPYSLGARPFLKRPHPESGAGRVVLMTQN